MAHPLKARLIANPVSGTDRASDELLALNERLRPAVGDLDIVLTVAKGDAAHAAEQAVRDGYDHLFVAGGDGTLNEVVNGVAAVDGGLRRVTFGLLPLGTGNDFAHAIGVPENLDAAVEVLARGAVAEIDVATLNNRRFINVSAGGFVAEASDAVDPGLKSVAGKLAYLIGGAGALLDHEPHDFTVTVDDRAPFDVNASLFAVCNSRLVGGGRLIAPYAIVDDGELDICIVEGMKTLELASLLAKVSAGDHVRDERVRYLRGRAIEIRSNRPFKVNTDGEVIETTLCRYSIASRAATFFAGELPFSMEAAE